MSQQELEDIVQITVEGFNQDDRADILDNNEDGEERPQKKKRKLFTSQENSNNNQDITLIKSMLVSFNASIGQRLEAIESKLQSLDATCKAIGRKLDSMFPSVKSPIQVPMVAGSPQGVTQTWNKVRCVVPQTNVIVSSDQPKPSGQEDNPLENLLSNTVNKRRQNTILVKVPGPEESQEDQDSGSDASDTVSNGGNSSNAQNTQNVTLITLNSEDDYPAGTWLGDDNNPEMRVRCPVSPADMLHITTNCRTAEKMALTLLDYLFHREVQAMSNLSGLGKHGKKQLDPLMIYGIRCHLFHKFGISESDWYRIKQSIDSKCRTAWRRKQRGQSLAVKSFSKRTPRAQGGEEGIEGETAHIEASAQQTVHYTLANQQVQIHRIGEDGQVQVIPQGQLHIAQVPQREEMQITQDSEGNLQIHQVHVGQDGQGNLQIHQVQFGPEGQVLRGAQLIAVASADTGGTAVEGSTLPPDIQVQYVQLAPVADHTGAVQAELAPALQADMEVKEAIQGTIQGESGEVVQIVTSVAT